MYTLARAAASAAVAFALMAGHAWAAADAANGERAGGARRATWLLPTKSKRVRTSLHSRPLPECLVLNRDKLTFFLLDPHPKMPDMSLTRGEAADFARLHGADRFVTERGARQF